MKKIIYVIIGIAIIYLLLCLFGPSQIKIERSVAVNAPIELVKAKLGDLKFMHDEWSPWTELDPKMKTSYEKNIGEVGHKYSWKGNKDVGEGTLEITKIEGDSIVMNLHFEGMGDSKTYYTVIADNSGNKVTWGIEMNIGFFGRGMMLFMNMDKMMGADFEKGLVKFKMAMEKMPVKGDATEYTIEELNWEEKTFIGKKGTFKFEQLSAFFGENYGKLFADLGKAKEQPIMAPSAIYFKWDDKTGETECAAVANVSKGTTVKGWDVFSIPASKVLHIAYYGSWGKSMNAHMAMDEYIKKNNLPMQSHVVEEYVTDPMIEKDTAKWLTNIFYVLPAVK